MIRITPVVVTGRTLTILVVARVFGFLFLFELFPQSFDFVNERLLIRAESLNHIEQFLNRQLNLVRQLLLGQQLLDLLNNRFYV